MNKLFALILAWAMLAALVSCGTNTGNASSTETGSLNETASQEGQEDRNEAMPPKPSDGRPVKNWWPAMATAALTPMTRLPRSS